ncbi:bifunctional adenosylcobinamide kinase/adenosylcobinamide-phosphate guanylyltransferase [Proteinivorax tanatarense]|uniref:Adenosylcobinamide kinase n=1 Tax=Proteinivorax tanatarense TaxID=1260629 RepID=A0AAU7VJR0_9FIRM
MSSKITMVTGGARSGKSSFSEQLAKEFGEKILYLATSIAFDEEMKKRIKEHKKNRPSYWKTHEGYKDLHKALKKDTYDGVLLDCITVMISNLLLYNSDFNEDSIEIEVLDDIEDQIVKQVNFLIDTAIEVNTNLILVTNEVGSGIVPEHKLGRVFRDMAGRINQIIAKRADEVYLVVSSIPVKIK